MKTRIAVCVAVVLLLTALTCLPSAFAGEAETESYKDLGGGSMASFFTVDEAGIATEVNVFALDEMEHRAPGPAVHESRVDLRLIQYDYACPPNVPGCPGALLSIDGSFPIAGQDFLAPAVSKGSWATLNTTVNALDEVSGLPIQLFIDLAWECTGDVERDPTRYTVVEPGVTVEVWSTHITHCNAQASGTVSDDVTDFTPTPSWQASMFGEGAVYITVDIAP